jgi:hypothetical protein
MIAELRKAQDGMEKKEAWRWRLSAHTKTTNHHIDEIAEPIKFGAGRTANKAEENKE